MLPCESTTGLHTEMNFTFANTSSFLNLLKSPPCIGEQSQPGFFPFFQGNGLANHGLEQSLSYHKEQERVLPRGKAKDDASAPSVPGSQMPLTSFVPVPASAAPSPSLLVLPELSRPSHALPFPGLPS